MAYRSLIEQWFPAAIVGAESTRERAASSALPPINFIHLWFGRKPLAASRFAALASALPAWPEEHEHGEDVERVRQVLEASFPEGPAGYRKWFLRAFGITGDPVQARRSIQSAVSRGERTQGNAYGYPRAYEATPSDEAVTTIRELCSARTGRPSRVTLLDQFAGGGSIPFEAARLGFDTIAAELNPVASAVLAATVTVPFEQGPVVAELLNRYGERWVALVGQELAPYFWQQTPGEASSYVWAHAIPCPSTGHLTPLLNSCWLADTKKQRLAIALDAHPATGQIDRRLVEGPRAAEIGDRSYYGGGAGISLFTGDPIPSTYIKDQALRGRMQEFLLAIPYTRPGAKGREYRLPTFEDLACVDAAGKHLEHLRMEWEVADLIPDEAIEPGMETSRCLKFGWTHWRQWYTRRQLLTLGTYVKCARDVIGEARRTDGDSAARALSVYLALTISKAANYDCRGTIWDTGREKAVHKMTMRNFAFFPRFMEFEAARSLPSWLFEQMTDALDGVLRLTDRRSMLLDSDHPLRASVLNEDAADLASIPTDSVDLIVCDPPYDDAIAYGELSDFFYVWTKRVLRDTWPELSARSSADKQAEVAVNPALFAAVATRKNARAKGPGKTKDELARAHFEDRLAAAMREANRVLRPDGVMTVMYTHSGVQAWDTLGRTLLDAGFEIRSAWPVHTEGDNNLMQRNKNAVKSAILLTCRPRTSQQTAFWDDIRGEVASTAATAARRYAADGLIGVDLTVAAFGPVLSVLSRNWPVLTGALAADGSDEIIQPERALQVARAEVAAFKKSLFLDGRGLDLDPPSDWWLLAWTDFGRREFPFDEARKLGLALHLEAEDITGHRLATSRGGRVTLLTPAERWASGAVERAPAGDAPLVDLLHALMVVYDQDGLAEASRWMDGVPRTRGERFRAFVQAALKALPRARDSSGAWLLPEARILDSMAQTIFTGVELPPDPLETPEQASLFD